MPAPHQRGYGQHTDGQRTVVTIRIREWEPGDIETVREITWTTWLDAYRSFIPEADLKEYFGSVYTSEALRTLMASPQFRGLLAVEGAAAAGYAKIRFVPEEARCYVSSLYVLPAWQGRGCGHLLLAAAERHARAFGVQEIWLGVMTQNIPALRWYERNGFTFVDEQPFTMGSTTVPHRIGFRPLQPRSEDNRKDP